MPIRRPMSRPPAAADTYDDEDERPRRRRPADEDAPRSARRRPRDDEDEDEDDELPSNLISSGWGGKKQLLSEMPGNFAPNFSPGEDRVIIKFLEDGPVANYRQHWCDFLPSGQQLGHVCLKVDCPLCDVGHSTGAKICFNVVDFTDPENPVVKVWSVGIKMSNTIEAFAKEKRTSPLSRPDLYFSVWKTSEKKGSQRRRAGSTQTHMSDVKARDLLEDWDVEPLDEDALEKFAKKAFPADKIIVPTPRKKLEEIAVQYAGSDQDDEDPF